MYLAVKFEDLFSDAQSFQGIFLLIKRVDFLTQISDLELLLPDQILVIIIAVANDVARE